MAKITWKQLSKDDPIFSGRFVISSKNSPQKSTSSMKTSVSDTAEPSTVESTADTDSLRGEALVKSLLMSDERLEELGLIARYDLVISLGRTKRPGPLVKSPKTHLEG